MSSLIIILLLIFIVFEYFIFPMNNNQMTIKYKLLNNIEDVEVIILGNSHTFFGINPDESSFKMINIANKGRKIETDYYLLKENLSKLQNVKYVIIPISHYTLLSGSLSSQEKRLYYRYFNLKKYNQNFYDNLLLLNNPFKELVDNLFLGSKKNNNLSISKKGWRANKNSYNNNLVETKERIKAMEGRYLDSVNHIDFNLSFVKKIDELTKDHNFKVIFVVPPYHPDYYKFSNTSYHKFIEKKVDSIIKYNSYILKAKKINIKQNKYFENSDHLNVKGAKLFTKKLDSILKLSL